MKKGFSLTELLIVVVLIGALAAIALPKFSKMLETRRLNEAEKILLAVRAEQEMRCSLDKGYTTNTADLASYPTQTGNNFTFSLSDTGITASRVGKAYAISIPSYYDGGFCCSGTYCGELGRSYPSCDEYDAIETQGCAVPEAAQEEEVQGSDGTCTNKPDIMQEAESCGCTGIGLRQRYFDEVTCKWSAWSTCNEKETGCTPTCEVPTPATQTVTCGCTGSGTKSREFDEGFCDWDDEWTACTEQETNCCPISPDPETEACGCAGDGTHTRTYDTSICNWGDWSTCTTQDTDCNCDPTGSKKSACMPSKLENGKFYFYTWSDDDCSCTESCKYGEQVSGSTSTQVTITWPAGGESALNEVDEVASRCLKKASVIKCSDLGISPGDVGVRGDPACFVCDVAVETNNPRPGQYATVTVRKLKYSCGYGH